MKKDEAKESQFIKELIDLTFDHFEPEEFPELHAILKRSVRKKELWKVFDRMLDAGEIRFYFSDLSGTLGPLKFSEKQTTTKPNLRVVTDT